VRAGRWLPKRAAEDLVHLREVAHVDEEHARLDDVREGQTGALQHGLEVVEDARSSARRRRPRRVFIVAEVERRVCPAREQEAPAAIPCA